MPASEEGPDTEARAPERAEPQETNRRRPKVSKDTPRERREYDPGKNCPDCGGDLRVIGEDVSELIDMIAAQLKVIEIARIKKSCRRCEKIVQAPAPSRPIPRSMAGPNLLAYVLVSKFDDHVPLYRQNEIFARMGADIADTTLVDWCGGAMKALVPLIEKIEAEIMASDLLHADDTPIRVLDRSKSNKGLGKGVRKGRIWAYVRHQRPWAGQAPPGAVYQFAPDWKEDHVLGHLSQAGRILQADGYKGYAKLYAPDPEGKSQFREAACWAHLRRDFHDVWAATKSEVAADGYKGYAKLYAPDPEGKSQFREAACWAHLRRDFHDVWAATKSEVAREALDRIGKFYDIERAISGKPAELRLAVRQKETRPKIDAFRDWAEKQLTRIPGKSDLAKAFRYGLSRWSALTLFLEDGRVAIDNNAAERALRPIGVGRRNWLFAGSDAGGETLARALTVIETAKMNGLDPQAYLADILDRIHDHMNNRLGELLPWNWAPMGTVKTEAA